MSLDEAGIILRIPLDDVRPFAGQPRVEFDQRKLQELADSIGEIGQQVSALVIKLPRGSSHKYELIDGERRWRACRLAGVATLKAEICPPEDAATQFKRSIAANFGRAEHTPLEIANAIRTLRDDGMTLAKIAKLFGKSDQWVMNYERLLNLSAAVMRLVTHEDPEKRLSVTHAQRIAELPKSEQLDIAKKCVSQSLTLFDLANRVRKTKKALGIESSVERSPSKDWRILSGFFDRVKRELAPLMEFGEAEITQFLSTRSDSELQRFEPKAEEASGDLAAFADYVLDLVRAEQRRRKRA